MSPGKQVCDCQSIFWVSLGRALVRYAKGLGLESRLILDFSPPYIWSQRRITFANKYLTLITYTGNMNVLKFIYFLS